MSTDNNSKGILLIIAAMTLFAMQDSLIKFIFEKAALYEIFFGRYFVAAILLFCYIKFRGQKVSLKTYYPFLTVVRVILHFLAFSAFFISLTYMPLATANALFFSCPFFVSIFAKFFLKEFVGIRRWLAMIVGFTGAVIVLRPDVELGFGPLLILCASLMWSSSMLMAKTLTKTDSISSITFWQAAGLIPATFILAVPVWQWPNLSQLFMFLMIAIAGTLVHWFLNEALKRAEISALLPLDYLRLIWSVSMGFIFFNELPHAGLWFGAALILGASTYIGIRQAQKKKEDLNTNSNISI